MAFFFFKPVFESAMTTNISETTASFEERMEDLLQRAEELRKLSATLTQREHELTIKRLNLIALEQALKDRSESLIERERILRKLDAKAKAREKVEQEMKELREICERAKRASENAQAAYRRIKSRRQNKVVPLPSEK